MWRLSLWVLCSLYILAGLPLAPFHGDEGQHLWLAQDYVAYFVLHQPAQISPPIAIDSEAYLRLLNGTVSAYTTGFILWHSGRLSVGNWQAAWYFGEDFATNRAAGRYPKDSVLQWGRLSSAFFLMAALALVMAWGQEGVIIALLLATHPVILLNARRVMQEGALIFFTLALLTQALRTRAKPSYTNHAIYGVLAGLALASKPTALIALAGITWALPSFRAGWFIAFWALFTYLLMTPALWSDPIGLSRQAADLRANALAGQTASSGVGYHTWQERVGALWENPFPAKVQYYESPAFAAGLADQIQRYDSDWRRGWTFPPLMGWFLAALGVKRLWRECPVILPWVLLTGLAILLAVPLAWQRYYLPWTLASVVLVGYGILESYKIGTQIRAHTLN